MTNLVIFLACFLISSSSGIIPSSSISSPYVTLPQPVDVRRNNYNYDRRGYYPGSYIIYDGDISSLPGSRDRPQTSSTRSWHLEFNQKRQNQPPPQPPSTPVAYSSVFSNLIQVYDKPQNMYNREHATYSEPNGGGYSFHVKSRPIDVPKYDVIYPYQPEEQNYYNRDKLPDNFPKPFYPNKDFQFKDPSITSDVRKDYGFYHAQTISYPSQEDRASSRSNCNYIRLNEKGFPIGNEMCGRSISDIILAPDYPTTGDLILEHRKRYRGTNRERSLETNQVGSFNRKKRNAQNIQERFNSYFPSSECCGRGMGYGYRPSYQQDFGYIDNNRFMPRPYEGTRNVFGGYGYRNQGQYNYEDDVGEETSGSRNQGLTSYMENRGRGDRGRFKEDDGYGDSEEDYDRYNSGSGNRDGNSNKSTNNSSSDNGRKSNSNSRSNRRNETSNRSSNNNQQSSDTSSQGNNKSVNNRRNFGSRSDSEDSSSGSGGSNVNNHRNFGRNSEDGYSSSGGSNVNSRSNFGRNSEDSFGASGFYNQRNFGGGSEDNSGGSSVYNRRNFGRSDSEDNFGSSSGGSNNRNGGNNYSYLRNDYNERNNGPNMYSGSPGRGFGGFGDGYRRNNNMGGNSNGMNSSPYNNNGYNSFGRFNK